MQSAGNIYSAEPAVPILAHSLLTKPLEPGNQDLQAVSEPASSKEEPAASDAWNLKYDIDRGIRTSGHTVFRCGKVVGFSRLREKGNDDDSQSVTRVKLLLTPTLARRMMLITSLSSQSVSSRHTYTETRKEHHQARIHLLYILPTSNRSPQRHCLHRYSLPSTARLCLEMKQSKNSIPFSYARCSTCALPRRLSATSLMR